MKIRVPMDCECSSFVTKGKVYEAEQISDTGNLFSVIADDDLPTLIFVPMCGHLYGAAWEIVDG